MSPEPVIKQIHIYELAGFLVALGGALIQGGCQASHLPELFGQYAKLACVDCGIALSGADLAALALPGSADEPIRVKLVRIRQGYCARQGCASHYYTLTLAPHPGLDWTEVLQAIDNPIPVAREESASQTTAPSLVQRLDRRTLLRISAIVAIILALLICWHFLSGGTIPGFGHKHKYTLDPHSLTTD